MGKAGTQTARDDQGLLPAALIAFLVGAGYYCTAKIGFIFALQPGSISTLWMPNAILLTGLLVSPKRWWWLLILVAVPAHFASELQSGVPPLMVSSWFFSNAFQALIGAVCICYLVDGRLRFDRFRDVTIFVLFGAFLAPFVTSFLDIGLMKVIGWGAGTYWEIWRIRFLSNVLATLTLVPVLVMWATNRGKGAVRKLSPERTVEAALLAIGLFAIGIIVFTGERGMHDNSASLLYLPMPFLVWATVRFGPRGASMSLLLIMLLTIGGATRGRGPFVGGSPAFAALSIQWFLIVVSIPLIALAAVVEERRRAGETARNNEERLTLALNAAQMGTWDWQLSDDSVNLSDAARRMFGLNADEPAPAAESFYAMIHPDDRESVKRAISRALAELVPYEAEFRLVSPGSTVWLLGKGKVLCDEVGRPQRMLGVNIDITERKQAEEALRQSQTILARTEAFSLLMVTHVDLDGRWLKVPPTLCELLGYTEQELLSGGFKDVTHPEDFEADWSQCQRLIRGEIRSFDLEKRYIHKDGHIIWVYLNCSIVEDNHGKPVHFLTYIRDITDRKLAEQAVLESNERYRAILRALPDMMFLQTKEGTYLDYYARDLTSLVTPPETFLGRNVREIMPTDLSERFMESVGRLNGIDETQVLEYSLPIANEERHYEARLVSAEGDRVLSIVRDVTDARRAADALRRSEEKLRQSNRQIRALAARLIAAQDSERRRISLLLHDDVSQNIAAIGITISRLKRRPPASEGQMAAELDRLGQHINDLTTQIRQLSHQLHPEVLEHMGLVAALESQVREFGHEVGLEVTFVSEVSGEPIPSEVAVCLYRVALEALRNITRHSGARFARVALTESDGHLTLEVSDSGRGFDVETARQGPGIGVLGAEERVKLLLGSFEIRSTPESGTALVARVPLTRGQAT